MPAAAAAGTAAALKAAASASTAFVAATDTIDSAPHAVYHSASWTWRDVFDKPLSPCNGISHCRDPVGVCAKVTNDFWPELGRGALSKMKGNRCVSNSDLGEWFRGEHEHLGVAGIDCDATSRASFLGDSDA